METTLSSFQQIEQMIENGFEVTVRFRPKPNALYYVMASRGARTIAQSHENLQYAIEKVFEVWAND